MKIFGLLGKKDFIVEDLLITQFQSFPILEICLQLVRFTMWTPVVTLPIPNPENHAEVLNLAADIQEVSP